MKLETSSKSKLMFRVTVRFIVLCISMFAVIFVSAGRWDYWQGWTYFAMWVAMQSVNAFLLPEELIDERSQVKAGTKKWDVLIYVSIALLSFLVPLIASLDGGRYHWTNSYPLWVNISAFVIILLGSILFVYCMQINKFFSATVRIQKDRDQYVIDQGPYAFVRHPGYSSMMINYLLAGVAMNSIVALIPGCAMATVFIIRTKLEDQTLQNELPGRFTGEISVVSRDLVACYYSGFIRLQVKSSFSLIYILQ
ncbi:MAG: isoprenylcysteine carboxylmethyltransferase family protein [Tissierellales bacterium]|nr:isoprenylcysteine carboxylmethyltransferase family protein [Tissierellales bacterium]